jgi:hypothetical protein
VTIAFANCAAMRNLVTGRVVPQPAAQVTAKPLGLDLGMGPDLGMGSDLEMGPDKGRAGDSKCCRRSDVRAVFRYTLGLPSIWRSTSRARPSRAGDRSAASSSSWSIRCSSRATLCESRCRRWWSRRSNRDPFSCRHSGLVATLGQASAAV